MTMTTVKRQDDIACLGLASHGDRRTSRSMGQHRARRAEMTTRMSRGCASGALRGLSVPTRSRRHVGGASRPRTHAREVGKSDSDSNRSVRADFAKVYVARDELKRDVA